MKKSISLVISLLIAVLMVYASGMKLWSYIQTKSGFDFFPFLDNHHKMVFWGLIVIQPLIARLLMYRRTRLIGLYVSFFLLASLSTYLYLIQHYTDHIPCSCTGIMPGFSWEVHMWFTIGFTMLAAIAIIFQPDKNIHARE